MAWPIKNSGVSLARRGGVATNASSRRAAPARSQAKGVVGVFAQATAKAKCVRCWHRREDVGADPRHPELCMRCVSNIEGPGETREWF